MKPGFLYHGSPKKIEGGYLLPRKPLDLGKRAENTHDAVYATEVKEIAIAMALVKCKGVKSSSVNFTKNPVAVISEGWPEQEFIYLYILPSDGFEKTHTAGHQWVSLKPVKPVREERLAVRGYLHLVRKK